VAKADETQANTMKILSEIDEGDSRLAMDAAALVQSTRKEMNNGRNERQD
jgi:hypothetical protein